MLCVFVQNVLVCIVPKHLQRLLQQQSILIQSKNFTLFIMGFTIPEIKTPMQEMKFNDL